MNGILLIAEKPEIVESFTGMLAPKFDLFSATTVDEGMRLLQENYRKIVAVLVELALARRTGFRVSERMKTASAFSLIPMIAISDELPVPEDMDCIEHGYFDLITAYAPQPLVYKRIGNAIRAKESLSLTQLEKMLKQLPACIFLKDEEGKYVFSTQYWRHLETGGDPNWTIRGKTDLEIRKDKDNARRAMEADRHILETGEGTDYIIQENEDGVLEYLQLIKRPVYDEDGRISGIIALINNVTDHQLLKLELEKRAKTDALTGLLNKRAAQELMQMFLSGQQSEGARCALLMIDVDLFKRINDTFGHAEGDRVLAEIGRTIKNSCRAEDVAARIGGDEFLILMRSVSSCDNATRLAERLQNQVQRAFRDDPLAGYVSLSIGIAMSSDHATRLEELFKDADSALYKVKAGGRGSYRVYE